MELGLTIPLQTFLKHRPPAYGTQQDMRLCWDLHIVKPGGTPSLFAVHASSRFAFLLAGPSPAGWENIPQLFAKGLAHSLGTAGYTQAQVVQYLALAGPPCITKTHGRRPVAFLNQAVEDLYALPAGINPGYLFQPQLVDFLNGCPCRAAGHAHRGTAGTFLRVDISALGLGAPGAPAFSAEPSVLLHP